MRGVPLPSPADPLAAVEAAIGGAGGRSGSTRHGAATAFLAAPLTPALRRLGVLYAVYLCFASLRIAEVIPALAIPKLPMMMSLVLAAGLVLGVPGAGWTALWRAAPALRWQALLVVLAIVTVPLGIWMSNSLDKIYPGYLISITVFVAGLVLLRDRVVLVRTLQLLTATLALITVLTVFFGVGAGSVEAGRLTVGVSLDPNDFAWILATFVPIALWLGVRRKATSVLWFGVAILLVMGIVPTQSRGGFLALIAAGVVLNSFGATGWRRVLLFVTLAVMAVGLLAYINASGASRLTDFSSYEGGTGRTDLWKQGLRWMVQRPWGFGIGNYATYNFLMTRGFHSGHSAYVNIGVELGVLGITAYLAIWLGVARGLTARRQAVLRDSSQKRATEEATTIGFILAAMAGNAGGAFFLNTQYAALTLFIQSLGAALLLSPMITTRTLPNHDVHSRQHSTGARSRASGMVLAPPRRVQYRD